MKILITGGAGFIGSHLCDKYVEAGHNVICLDNFMTGNILNIRSLIHKRNFKLINGDIRDFDLMEKIMPEVDVVFHLAAQIHVDRSVVEPKATYEINVIGTQNVLESARMYDVKKIIYASTSEVYGSAQYAPIDEKHPLEAPHPYGASKIAADRMCYSYLQTYGMNIVIMRLFNVFGPRQKDMGYGGVISIFTRRILNNMPPIIYGDGQQTRDYTYITDAIKAYDLAINHNEPITEPINFGTGKEVSIINLAEMILDLTGKNGDLKQVHVQPRIGEVKRLIADATKAKKLLGWSPTYDFKKGLKEFIEWYKNYGFEKY
jgi:UDP-glucose 4-epimerase